VHTAVPDLQEVDVAGNNESIGTEPLTGIGVEELTTL